MPIDILNFIWYMGKNLTMLYFYLSSYGYNEWYYQ